MKKLSFIALSLCGALALAGCGKSGSTGSSSDGSTAAKSEGVMTHAEYIAADLDTEVTIETYVQAKQSWWDDKARFYTQDEEGGYFIYDMACSESDYNKLTPGTRIKVKGFKSEWSGEVEITDATFEIEDGQYIATATDVTSLLGTDSLIDHQNELVAIKGATIEAADDAGSAFLFGWDGSANPGDDLYFNVSVGGATYTFTVESYLTDSQTPVYQALAGSYDANGNQTAAPTIQVGDTVDLEGFLYWYEGPQPHITSITVK